jgi:hypothetical protein
MWARYACALNREERILALTVPGAAFVPPNVLANRQAASTSANDEPRAGPAG